LAAALALAAAGVDFDGDALADPVFVDARAERDHGLHIFVAGREVLVVRQATAALRRRAMADHLEIGRADSGSVDASQDCRLVRHRYGLHAERKVPGSPEHPRLHGIWDRVVRIRLHSGWCVHLELLPGRGPYPAAVGAGAGAIDPAAD